MRMIRKTPESVVVLVVRRLAGLIAFAAAAAAGAAEVTIDSHRPNEIVFRPRRRGSSEP